MTEKTGILTPAAYFGHKGVSRRKLLFGGSVFLAAAFLAGVWLNRRLPYGPTQIFEGITYGCQRLDADTEGGGLMHWVQIDLASPGIEIYVTPLDSEALSQGWQFRLRRTASVVATENLAVGVNGTMFNANSGWLPMAGDLARAVETAVADHRVSHVWEHTYLLWFDDDLIPHIETSKPPSEAVLGQARWGIGGQEVGLQAGKIREGIDRTPVDARTAVGIDQERRLLILAVFEKASPRRVFEKLSELGALEGMLLDGGNSTGMALGAKARGVPSGVLLGGWRPVATHLGVRANPLLTK
jgi:hypothetical protein